MDADDKLIIIVIFLIFFGYFLSISRDNIYNSLVTILAAAIAAGWLFKKKRKKG
jgi:uncharacterized membrane protein (DUF106 family)